MIRIILIGNGFDLAHNLPTSYSDFINYLWEEIMSNFYNKMRLAHTYFENRLVKISFRENNIGRDFYSASINFYEKREYITVKEFQKYIQDRQMVIEYKNSFFALLTSKYQDEQWSDIEEIFYEKLLNCQKTEIVKFNNDFELMKELLNEYLSAVVQKNSIKRNELIYNNIYAPLYLDDFTGKSREIYIEYVYEVMAAITTLDDDTSPIGVGVNIINDKNIEFAQNFIKKCPEYESMSDEDKLYLIGHCNEFEMIPDFYIFLTFNYTNLERLYLDKEHILNFIHIHGELNNNKNPIIFGYGDELDENYKVLENKKNNDYLENIKSIQYLNTKNYSSLFSMLETDYFQVSIFGHSCGNSDRTLLNKLFEHPNCKSIKPYYYKYGEKDNYTEIIKNISRNFNDKSSMREKVVNKTHCVPMS